MVTDRREARLPAPRPLTPVEKLFVSRLNHQIETSRSYEGAEGWREKLLARGIYSTFRDLVDLDLENEARRILKLPIPTTKP